MIDFLEGYKGIPWSEVVQGVAYLQRDRGRRKKIGGAGYL